MDCSLPGSSVHGIFQARVLEWGAIAFSVSIYRKYLLSTYQMAVLHRRFFKTRIVLALRLMHINAKHQLSGISLWIKDKNVLLI